MADTATAIDPSAIARIITEAKKLAIEYRTLTGRPLGITGEIAEYEAAKLLNLRLAAVRQAGYDALRADGTKLQIKARCIQGPCKPGERLGSIKLEREWDAVLLVLLDADFEPLEIHEASRPAITDALMKPGSKARNERGALAVSKFKAIGKLVWRRTEGAS